MMQFPDAFQPYMAHFGCTLRAHYPGTLFRFPLRCAPARLPPVQTPVHMAPPAVTTHNFTGCQSPLFCFAFTAPPWISHVHP